MTTIAEALTEIVDSLTGAGIAATADPTLLELPGVLVMPGDIAFPYLDGSQFDMEFNLWLMAPDKGTVDTWIDLQELLTKVRTVFEIASALPINRPLQNHSSEPVPALLATISTTIS